MHYNSVYIIKRRIMDKAIMGETLQQQQKYNDDIQMEMQN